MANTKRGRDAKSGRFIPVAQAKRRKATSVVETVKPKPAKRRKAR